jgi:hypothetical protein
MNARAMGASVGDGPTVSVAARSQRIGSGRRPGRRVVEVERGRLVVLPDVDQRRPVRFLREPAAWPPQKLCWADTCSRPMPFGRLVSSFGKARFEIVPGKRNDRAGRTIG